MHQAIIARSVLALYSYDKNADDNSISNVLRQCLQLIAQFPTIIAYAYQAQQHYYKQQTLHIRLPKKEYSIAENIMYLIRPHAVFQH